MPTDFEHKIRHGDTFQFLVETEEEDVEIDLTGATIKFKLGPISESSNGYDIDRDDTHGKFIITLSAALMETLTGSKYDFGVEVTYLNGFKETLFIGTLILLEDVVP